MQTLQVCQPGAGSLCLLCFLNLVFTFCMILCLGLRTENDLVCVKNILLHNSNLHIKKCQVGSDNPASQKP